jgi:hypothetical protein
MKEYEGNPFVAVALKLGAERYSEFLRAASHVSYASNASPKKRIAATEWTNCTRF